MARGDKHRVDVGVFQDVLFFAGTEFKPEPLADGGLHAGNLLACRDLLAAIQEDRQPEASVYEARLTVEMIAAVFESHRLRRPVGLPLETRVNPLTLM